MLGKGIRRIIFVFNKIDKSFDMNIYKQAEEKIQLYLKKIEVKSLYEGVNITFTAISGKL